MDYRNYRMGWKDILTCLAAGFVISGVIAGLFYRSAWGMLVCPFVCVICKRRYQAGRLQKRKDQLLLETAQMVLDRLLEELEHVFSQKQTFREKLICYYLALDRLVEHIGVNFPMFFVGEPITSVMLECVDTFRKALFRRLGQELRSAQARGELDAALDAEMAAILLTTQMTPLLLKAMGRFEVEDAAGKIVDILMNGLAARPAPAVSAPARPAPARPAPARPAPAGAETAASEKQRKKD